MWRFSLPSGVRYHQTLLWIKAARWHGLTWQEFCDEDGDTQSFFVASYLTVMQCEAVEASEASKR